MTSNVSVFWRLLFITGVAVVIATGVALGGEYSFDTPSDDRWQYPFNFNAGHRATASCFGSTSDPNYTTFNDRDGIFIVAWRTIAAVPPGLPLKSYDVRLVRVSLCHQGATPDSPTGATWPIDLTPDEWSTMAYPISDVDPGQPLELFGAGFGPIYTYTNWVETSPYVGGDDISLEPRDPYPFVFDGNTANKKHVEDNVKDRFTPLPWAVGVPIGYTPGGQPAPFPVQFDINLSLSAERVLSYCQEQLAGGRLFVVVTSLRVTSMQAASGFPTFFTKEGAPLNPAAFAPLLSMTIVPTGDVNGDGRRGAIDTASLWGCLAGPEVAPPAFRGLTAAQCKFLFDFDEDGDVDLADVAIYVRRFN